MRNKILSVVERRQSGEEKEDIPFIDALLQSGVSHDQVMFVLLEYSSDLFNNVFNSSYCNSNVL